MNKVPKIYVKSYNDLIQDLIDRSKEYTPEWKFDLNSNDFGVIFSRIFCEMQENTIDTINRNIYKIYLTFLKLLEISPNPCVPSHGLVFVNPSKNSKISYVKKGAKINAQGKNDSNLIFETSEELFVMDTTIKDIFMTSDRDKNVSHIFSNENSDKISEFKLFDFSKFKNLQSKYIYIEDKNLFDFENSHLKFQFKNEFSKKVETELCDKLCKSDWQYFDEDDENWKSIGNISNDENNFISLNIEKNIGQTTVFGKESRYIRISMENIDKLEFNDILYSTEPKVIKPTEFTCGEEQLSDNTILPFGESYYLYSNFNIKCNEAFNKAGANIILSADLNFVKVRNELQKNLSKNYKLIMNDIDFVEAEPVDVSIENVVWEYWNGNAWAYLHLVDNSGIGFFRSKNDLSRKIEFVCPSDISSTEIGPISGLFIRARISKINNQFSSYFNYIVPCMKNIRIKYYYSIPKKCKNIISSSDLKWNLIDINKKNFLSFECKDKKSIYFNLSNPIKDGILNVFFDIEEGIFEKKLSFRLENWGKNSSGKIGWNILDIADFTGGFSKSGIIKIFGTRNFVETEMFGKFGYFIRAVLISDNVSQDSFPYIRNIKFNAINIVQKETRPYEYFSINKYEKDKICNLSSDKILDVEVWVDEHSEISDKEIDSYPSDKIEIEYDKIGIIEKIWIKWDRLKNLLSSGPNDRVYTFIPGESQVKFGNGTNGKIPTQQYSESIRIKYSVCEGENGNIEENSIKGFDSPFPYISGIYNDKRLHGGLDVENMEHASLRTLSNVENGNRLVSKSGFERALLLQNRNIFKIKCFPHTNKLGNKDIGSLTIIVLPKTAMIGYEKFRLIKENLTNYIDNYSSLQFFRSKKLYIQECTYVKISIHLVSIIKEIKFYQKVHETLNSEIKKFFNLIHGGSTGNGFNIGQIPTKLDVINNIKFIDGIKSIKELTLSYKILTKDGEKEILLNNNEEVKFSVPILEDTDIEIQI